jgi:hypothetical protein
LQFLYHTGYLNRFAFSKVLGNVGEFIYYADNPKAMQTMESVFGLDLSAYMPLVSNNREKNYAAVMTAGGSDDDHLGSLLCSTSVTN